MLLNRNSKTIVQVILLCLLQCIFCIGYSQRFDLNHIDSLLLKNKVKSISISLREAGNKTSIKIDVGYDGKIKSRSEIKHSKASKGKEVSIETYLYEDSILKEVVHHWTNKKLKIDRLTTSIYQYNTERDSVYVIKISPIKSIAPDTCLYVLYFNRAENLNKILGYGNSFVSREESIYDSLERRIFHYNLIYGDSFRVETTETTKYEDKDQRYTYNVVSKDNDKIKETEAYCKYTKEYMPVECTYKDNANSYMTYLANGLLSKKRVKKNGLIIYSMARVYEYYRK